MTTNSETRRCDGESVTGGRTRSRAWLIAAAVVVILLIVAAPQVIRLSPSAGDNALENARAEYERAMNIFTREAGHPAGTDYLGYLLANEGREYGERGFDDRGRADLERMRQFGTTLMTIGVSQDGDQVENDILLVARGESGSWTGVDTVYVYSCLRASFTLGDEDSVSIEAATCIPEVAELRGIGSMVPVTASRLAGWPW